jgi:hypothetical protein
MAGKHSKPKGTRKTDSNKEARTASRRAQRATAVTARKQRKPQPIPQAGRAQRRAITNGLITAEKVKAA